MKYKSMDSIAPRQELLSKFKTPITRIQSCSPYYSAVTKYGTMSLSIESFSDDQQQPRQWVVNRNNSLTTNKQYFTCIYQQSITMKQKQQESNKVGKRCQIICVTLFEKSQSIDSLRFFDVHLLINLIRSLFVLDTHGFGIQGSIHQALLYCPLSHSIKIDFTKIAPLNKTKPNLKSCLQCIQSLMKTKTGSLRLILLEDKILKLNIQKLRQASDLQQLMLMLNIHPNAYVEIQLKNTTPNQKLKEGMCIQLQRIKSVRVSELTGIHRIRVNGIWYDKLDYFDGKCTSCLTEIGQEKFKAQIFLNNTSFQLIKQEQVYLKVCCSLNQDGYQSIMIGDHIEKIDFINFLLSYLSYKAPIIKELAYSEPQNSLTLSCIFNSEVPTVDDNKQVKVGSALMIYKRDSIIGEKQYENKIIIKFPPNYVVKDEEISMIVEKGRLKSCRLDLSYMRINDTLLIFLSNSQKIKNISHLNLSDCHGISENGIQVLISSPYINIQSLSLLLHSSSSVYITSPYIQKLRKLRLQSKLSQNESQIKVSHLKLEQLSFFGVSAKINSINCQSLTKLILTQEVSIDEFRLIKAKNLKQLAIRLVESKKNIIESTSSFLTDTFGTKGNFLKQFSQGPCSKTLQILDLSHSTLRLKQIKNLLLMPQLRQISLKSFPNPGGQSVHLAQKITDINLSRTQIGIRQLQTMLQHIPIVKQLNILGNTTISREQFVKYIVTKKKFIRYVILAAQSFWQPLISKVGNEYQLVENVGIVLNNVQNPEQLQTILGVIVTKTLEADKAVNILTRADKTQGSRVQQMKKTIILNKVIETIARILKWLGKSKKHVKNLLIDGIGLYQQIEKMGKIDKNEGIETRIQWIHPPTLHLNMMQNASICNMTYLVQRMPKNYRLRVDMYGNRTIPKQCIQMLHQYAIDSLISINFHNCLFNFQHVIQWILDFPQLSYINGGRGQLQLNQNNFRQFGQKYLAFYMRVRDIKQLHIKCSGIEEPELLYPILCHILNTHIQTLTTVCICLNELQITNETQLVFQQLSNAKMLQMLTIQIVQCWFSKSVTHQNVVASLITLTKIKAIKLHIPILCFGNFLTGLKNVELLHIQIPEQIESQQQFSRILRQVHTTHLKSLSISVSSPHIHNPQKLLSASPTSSILQKVPHLEELCLNLQQYTCVIKQLQIETIKHS